MLGVADYLGGAAELAIAVGACVLGARAARSRLLPGWTGAPAWLADAVLAVALLLWIAQLLGAFGAFRPVAYTISCLAAGLALYRALPRREEPRRAPAPPAPPPPRLATWLALAIAGLLVVHWSIRTGTALSDGITGYDSAWYHLPFAAQFVQSGSTIDFAFVSPRYLTWFYPSNGELLDAVAILPFHRDMLVPLLNMAWLGGVLGAAWCAGRPYGAGPWSVAAAALLLDSGVLRDQAGDARNDTVGLFLLLASVAVLLNAGAGSNARRLPRGALAVAGLAAGLAAGTKLTFVVPAGGLLLGLAVVAGRGAKRRTAAAFGAPLLAGCLFWYGRNLIAVGNPLPWIHSLGPLRLDAPSQALGGRPQFSILDYVGDGAVWQHWFAPGLIDRLGHLWPLVLAAAVAGLLGALVARREPLLGVAGFAALIAVPVYLTNGTSAEGPAGMPVGFASSLRHLSPALLIGLVVLPLLPALRGPRSRWAVLAALVVLLAFVDGSGQPWSSAQLAGAVGVAALVVAAVAGAALLRRYRPPRPLLAAGTAVACFLILGVGWREQRHYLVHRYAGDDFRSPGLNAAFRWASAVHGRRIATTLTLQYPLFGTDLSNRVQFVGRRREDGGFVRASTCAGWLSAVNRGRFQFLVTSGRRDHVNRAERKRSARLGARLVLQRDLIEVYRLGGPLERAACDPARTEFASGGGRSKRRGSARS